jgi:hypothetical protein
MESLRRWGSCDEAREEENLEREREREREADGA